ncbi:cell synthase A catalytic subunit 2 [Dorcoceras hygrometricum]|uniref:Cell synthase A catalytic subunit 2 n=1 Tax=Dorcoceras hygrometricum TaxID=472368 RepID=A0A2Z6ZYE4_9LAMI|nr:cell synthase A catalytic subunit 2 [Dorcoceras hygrometricum]
MCKGLSIEDLPREDLVEVVKKSLATAEFLHDLSLKTPQQQHHARSSTRRRQGRAAMPSSHVPPEMTKRHEDDDEYEAPKMLRRSKRHAPDCGIGHRLGRR